MSWSYEPHVRGPGGGQGVLLEVRGALAGHFWTKFMKQKLLGTIGLVGVEPHSGVLQPVHGPGEVLQPWNLGRLASNLLHVLATTN
jgi:hypothetical protein